MEIIAHRGASHAAPENTLAAARLAWTENADALELDVRLTADRQLAVIHDETTKRYADIALSVGAASMAELQRLDVGRWKDAKYAGEKIPTLDAMLAGIPPGKRVFIEIKGGPEAVPVLERCLAGSQLKPTQPVVIAFDFSTVAAAKRVLPATEVAWILDHDAATRSLPLDEILRRCREGGLDGLDLKAGWPIDVAFVNRVHDAGLKLYVWTVDDPVVARRLRDAGVDGIATNRPGWLREKIAD
ncbi:MAG TPA: glycerophosphodiester phosphodiesterase [Opitutaceae bacterium]|nr:glycerophosphodiester phosphodiesterase [Opitutaceae bacterium]